MTPSAEKEAKRPYDLGRRLDQMDQSRAAILRAAQAQLKAKDYRRLTMASLAAESGVTRQTIHNLFGTKTAVLEAVFDVIALDGGMDKMREAMTQPSVETMLQGFVQVFSSFWAKNRLLVRRIHAIGAIDPELGAVIEARNRRRFLAARRVVRAIDPEREQEQRAALLAALTSFEFFDALAENSSENVESTVLELARNALFAKRDASRT